MSKNIENVTLFLQNSVSQIPPLCFVESMVDDLTADEYQVPDFDNPFQELFLWAVLLNRQEMAKILWKGGKVYSLK